MTDRRHGFGAGSSLLHARKAHLHQHQQRSTHKVNRRHTNNNSDNSRPRDSELSTPPEQLQVKPRQAELPDAAPTVADVTIVQTVSVVEYLDNAGATVSVETLASPPVTLGPTEPSPSPLPIPPVPEVTSDDVPVIPPAPTPTPSQAGDDAGSASPEPTPTPASSTQTQPPAPAESSPGPEPPVTSAPFPTASPPGFTPPSGFNSTSAGVAPHFNNSTLSANPFTNSSSTSASLRALTFISESESSSTSTSTSTFTSDTTSSFSTPTDFSNPNQNPGFNPAGIPAPQPTSSPTATPFVTAPTTSTPTSTVVGSVVGSVAGAALLVLAALLLLRYRRRRAAHLHLPGEDGSRALPFSSGPSGPSGDNAPGMSERGHPFAIPATLAALTRGPKRLSSVPEPSVAHSTPPTTAGTGASPERSFYRVSGKKLPSVMAHGGDGFTDPRQSTMSGASSVYRDSTDMITRIGTSGGGPPRFAVGTPMRPESGIPVFQPGPARTPVRTTITTEGPGGNPFDDVHELSPPRHQRDGVGRSLIGEDGSRGSRGSGSRFMEAL